MIRERQLLATDGVNPAQQVAWCPVVGALSRFGGKGLRSRAEVAVFQSGLLGVGQELEPAMNRDLVEREWEEESGRWSLA